MIRKPDVVIYHADCADGFGAAWAAWKLWGDEVEYVPWPYGRGIPDYEGKKLLLLDFSFSRADLSQLVLKDNVIQVVDHHASAQKDLSHLPPLGDEDGGSIQVYFDMNRSGAGLAWDLLHPGTRRPEMIEMIEDRDLWRFERPSTRAFSLWLRTHDPFDFLMWDSIHFTLENDPQDIMAEALAIERFVDARIEEALKTVHWKYVDFNFVPCVNVSPFLASDVCNKILLMDEYKDAPFAMAYYDHAKGRSYSLRSTNGRMDVSVVAKKYGGGGHRNAAGFGGPQ